MNSSEIVERIKFQATGDVLPEHDIMLAAASHIEAQEKLLSAVKEAYEAYLAALQAREHGGVAAHRCVDAIGLIVSQKDTP